MKEITVKTIENSDSNETGRPLRDDELDPVAGGLGGQSENVLDDTEGGQGAYKKF